MSAERMPPTTQSLLARPLAILTRVVVRFPMPTLALALGMAALAISVTIEQLGFRTSRLDLLNPQSEFNQLWIEYIDEFGDDDDAVVVVEGHSRDVVVPVLEEVSAALAREDQLFHAVLHEVDLSQIRAKGLHYVSREELRDINLFVEHTEPVLQGDWSRLNLGNTLGGICHRLEADDADDRYGAASAQAELERLANSLYRALAQAHTYQSPWPEMSEGVATLSELGPEYLLTNEGRLGFVLLRLARDESGFAGGSEAVDALRGLLTRIAARHPATRVGLTGLPVMENDEMRASQTSMMRASLLSLVGCGCLFVAAFGGVRHPLLTIAALLVGMAWSFGYITLSVGHLNILSVSFAVILIGLGIDFGVHYVARYLQLVREHRQTEPALIETVRTVGPGIVVGAVTTSFAFYSAGFTEFTGVAELGLIAGGGILLCALAALLILPAAIMLVDRRGQIRPMPEPLPVDRWIAPLMATPRFLMFTSLLFTGVLLFGVQHVRYDHNLLNLQPVGLESVELEKKLLAESDQSVWFALSMAESREELLERKARFLELPSVERTEEIVSLLPADHDAKQPLIAGLHERLQSLPERPPLIPVNPPAELGRLLARAEQEVLTRGGMQTARQVAQIRDLLRRMPETICYARLSEYQQQMAGDLLSRLYALRSISDPTPPELADLPEGLVDRFVGQHGRHLLKIYARGNIWNMSALEQFVTEVRTVDPRVTGNPLQAYEASLQMKSSYEQAALYSLAAILVMLYIDFRHLGHALLAMLPVGLGTAQMFGLLGILGIPLNPANLIVLPLILGIGVDDGVHVVHDFCTQRGRYRISASTASSVLVTSLTTTVGFGSLMIASHAGLQSLGRVLAIGVGCCMFTSLIMLPALLTWMTRDREDVADQISEEFPAHQASALARGRQPRREDAAHHLGERHHTPATDRRHASPPPRRP